MHDVALLTQMRAQKGLFALIRNAAREINRQHNQRKRNIFILCANFFLIALFFESHDGKKIASFLEHVYILYFLQHHPL
jgi:hypothetical protein